MTRAEGMGTRLVELGRSSADAARVANPPLVKASTVFFDDPDALVNGRGDFVYGRTGSPLTRAFQEAMCGLEGGEASFTTPSGLGAITLTLTALSRTGDHVLFPDSMYGPGRRICEGYLREMGVETQSYEPGLGGKIETLFRDNTRLLMMEAPGSYTFEVDDISAAAAAARGAGIWSAVDNTWATPVFYRPLERGVDVSIHSVTKYISGHADVMMGVVSAKGTAVERLASLHRDMGICTAPESEYAALRGLRTLEARLKVHERRGLELARWLEGKEGVERVLHPALEGCPGHEVWKRDYDGSSGLFTMELAKGTTWEGTKAFLSGLKIFRMGWSWGGYESLAAPGRRVVRDHDDVSERAERMVRLHAGLEDEADLRADLERGFTSWRKWRDAA